LERERNKKVRNEGDCRRRERELMRKRSREIGSERSGRKCF
jgi:hypothetical protein